MPITALANLVFSILFVSPYGIIGVAAASVIMIEVGKQKGKKVYC
jgi:O-antigen/teichoic acid export membrane protein